ncbi:LysR family transcriptional regulator [Pseudaminobacter sp. 19-2017]|uniref:LysR family transcriptional regulator n=1 Tax=Pseudaminobacter soli (ex Zhang et al. 2022) TaxID=2831468 RepID=A0A942DXK4_9HYPH|nr:LysR substrate-binding domain-containing protein [Pseudaminobacter soli]MBS3649351.1 LysR family transcriptional regulator [Pseudaminobacter soli]
MRLTHRQLEIFQSLMHTLNVTETAAQLYSSQPTISRELKGLEATLGFNLFHRENRRLEATPQAVALNVIVQRSFVSINEIARAALTIQGDRLERVTVACLPAFAHALLPSVIKRFREGFPNSAIKIHSLEETALTRDLLSKFFDLAIVEGNIDGNSSSILSLYAGDLLCIMPRSHILAKHSVLQAEHFDGHDFIYYSEEDSYRRQVDEQFEAAKSSRRLLIETTTATSIGTLVAADIGVSIVNPLTALAFEGPQIAVRPLAQPIPYYLKIWQPQPTRKGLPAAHFVEAIVKSTEAIVASLSARNLCGRP